MDFDPHVIGQRLKERRGELGLTLRELGASVRLAPSFLSDIERGAGRPSLESLSSIAAALRLPLPELFAPADGAPVPVDLRRVLADPRARVTYDGQPLSGEEREKLLQVIGAALELREAGKRQDGGTEIEQFAAHMEGEYGRPPSPELRALIRAVVREVREEHRAREEGAR